MTKLIAPYLIHLAVVLGYIYWLSPAFETDHYLYLYSLIAAWLVVLSAKGNVKAKAFRCIAFQSITVWMCHLYLLNDYRTVTKNLVGIRQIFIVVLVLFEIFLVFLFVRNYRRYKVEQESALKATERALLDMGVPAELTRVFVVEVNIWRTLYQRICSKISRSGKGEGLEVHTGYTKKLFVGSMLALGLAFICIVGWIPGFLKLALGLGAFYLIILFHCDYTVFQWRKIIEDESRLVLPNGVFGEIEIEKANIALIDGCEGWQNDLNVCRLKGPSMRIQLRNPIDYFGRTVSTIGVAVNGKPAQLAQVKCRG